MVTWQGHGRELVAQHMYIVGSWCAVLAFAFWPVKRLAQTENLCVFKPQKRPAVQAPAELYQQSDTSPTRGTAVRTRRIGAYVPKYSDLGAAPRPRAYRPYAADSRHRSYSRAEKLR